MGGGGDGGGIGGGGGAEGEEEKAASTTTDGMKIKIVHFVRNPFEMASSNYFYHAQDPTVSGNFLEMYTREKERVFFIGHTDTMMAQLPCPPIVCFLMLLCLRR